jgi:F420-0:gamma-glutamyl ligase-like protein
MSRALEIRAGSVAPNAGKSLAVEIAGVILERLPVRTHVVTAKDSLVAIVRRYAFPHLRPGDVLFLSERMVAITQGRAIPIDAITPSPLAVTLSRHVTKTPAGIGVGSPWTMELAFAEAGKVRVLAAAAVAALTRPLRVRGLFYRIAGQRVASIDGPCANTLPPFDRCATLGPDRPNAVARRIAQEVGCAVVIVDANDLGVVVLGRSDRAISERWARRVFADNPLGQSRQQTPMAIVRRAELASRESRSCP